jgi:outer membrane lipoprotein-sorting protein
MRHSLLTALLLLGITYIARADEADAKAILEKSADATSHLKSLKADMLTETFATTTPQRGVLFQKRMPDGTLLMRVQMESPTSRISQGTTNVASPGRLSYTLISPKGAYTVIGDKAIRMDGVPGMDKLKDIMASDALKKLAQDAESTQLNSTVTPSILDGKECWVISIPTSPEALEAIKNALSQGPQKDLLQVVKMKVDAIPIPAKTVTSIDKQTYLIIKQDSVDANDKVIQSIVFKNIQLNSELADELFKLPDNVKIEDMSTIMQNAIKSLKQTK